MHRPTLVTVLGASSVGIRKRGGNVQAQHILVVTYNLRVEVFHTLTGRTKLLKHLWQHFAIITSPSGVSCFPKL